MRLKKIISELFKKAAPSMWVAVHAHRLLRKQAEREVHLLPSLIEPDENAIDVGANVGDYTFLLRSLAKHVHAFEPNPKLHLWLRRCFGTSITLHPCALSSGESKAILFIPLDSTGDEIAGHASLLELDASKAHRISVPTKTLDSFDFENIGFLKIDIEGHEEAALRGARELLLKCRPNILVEAEERHTPNAVKKLADFLRPMNYRGYYLYDSVLMPLDSFDVAKFQTLGQEPYINNFLFVARDGVLQKIEKSLAQNN